MILAATIWRVRRNEESRTIRGPGLFEIRSTRRRFVLGRAVSQVTLLEIRLYGSPAAFLGANDAIMDQRTVHDLEIASSDID